MTKIIHIEDHAWWFYASLKKREEKFVKAYEKALREGLPPPVSQPHEPFRPKKQENLQGEEER